ncbi:MAG: LPS export ABC transporter permease LptG [Pseudobacteriovorax sp.]|nr:LPS export ABC transporter permease LptG [Pseudobacteriovorax sp.]
MTLFLYVLKDYLKFVFGTLLLCVFLFLLFDFIEKTTRYIPRYTPETGDLVKFYIYRIPSLLLQALPISSLLSSVITMVLMSRTNEITAMRAAGMGPLRVGIPIAVGGFLLSVFSFILGEIVLPESAKKAHYIKEVKIEQGSETQLAEGARWLRQDDSLFTFKDYDPVASVMYGIKVISVGKDFRPKKTYESEVGVYRPSEGDWVLSNVKIRYFWPNGSISDSEQKDFLPVKIPIEPEKLKKERREANELSIFELNEIVVRDGASGIDILSYQVDMHVKMAFHFASFVVCLVGLRFGYKSERSMETARSILFAVAIGISYWFFLNAGRALGKRGSIDPLFSAWAANIILIVISWISIIRARKG